MTPLQQIATLVLTVLIAAPILVALLGAWRLAHWLRRDRTDRAVVQRMIDGSRL